MMSYRAISFILGKELMKVCGGVFDPSLAGQVEGLTIHELMEATIPIKDRDHHGAYRYKYYWHVCNVMRAQGNLCRRGKRATIVDHQGYQYRLSKGRATQILENGLMEKWEREWKNSFIRNSAA